jgi:hypothetical protein
LWAAVQGVQTQQEEFDQKLDTVVLQLQDQMRVMKSEIMRTQLEMLAGRKQGEEAEGSQALSAPGPHVSRVPTACIQEDVHWLSGEVGVLQQDQQKQEIVSLKQHVTDIATEVCELFAQPLDALTESVRRAESDMQKLRCAVLDVQKSQQMHNHGADEMWVAMGKLDKLLCQSLDAMKTEVNHAKLPVATDGVRSQTKNENNVRGCFSGTPSGPQLSSRIKQKVQEVSPTSVSESRQTSWPAAIGKLGEERRAPTSTCADAKDTPEPWKQIYPRSQAATQLGVK